METRNYHGSASFITTGARDPDFTTRMLLFEQDNVMMFDIVNNTNISLIAVYNVQCTIIYVRNGRPILKPCPAGTLNFPPPDGAGGGGWGGARGRSRLTGVVAKTKKRH